MWAERLSKISRRSSCVKAHHCADFDMGIMAAHVASGRPRPSCTAAREVCSDLVTYRWLLVTPRSTQLAPDGTPATLVFWTSRLSAGSSDSPATLATRVTRHRP